MTDDRKNKSFCELTAKGGGFVDHGAEHTANLLLQPKSSLIDPQIAKTCDPFRHLSSVVGHRF